MKEDKPKQEIDAIMTSDITLEPTDEGYKFDWGTATDKLYSLMKMYAAQPQSQVSDAPYFPKPSDWIGEFKKVWYRDNDIGLLSKEEIKELWDSTERTCHIIYKYQRKAFEANSKSQVSDEDIEKMAEDAWAKEPFNDMDKFCDTFIKGAKAALKHSSADGWIDVKDRLPDYDENVLWVDEQFHMFISEIDHDNNWQNFQSWNKDFDGNLVLITHWQPLPTQPK